MARSCLLFLLAGAAAVPVSVPPPEGAARPLAEVVEAARKARASGDWDNARRLYQEALRQDPRSGVIALELGETCLDAGDPAAAEQVLSRLTAARRGARSRGRCWRWGRRSRRWSRRARRRRSIRKTWTGWSCSASPSS